jgi:hypothetical protein
MHTIKTSHHPGGEIAKSSAKAILMSWTNTIGSAFRVSVSFALKISAYFNFPRAP